MADTAKGGIVALKGVTQADSAKVHKYLRCCNIANGCCLLLALPLTIPLIIVTVSVTDMVSFSTWVCLTYGAFFGLLFLFYENRHRKAGKKRDGSDKTWNDYLNEQYGFMQSFKARTAFLICLGFFMAGAGPLGWATSTFCFLHGIFNLYVYCGNDSIKQEVKGGTFNATGASKGDGFDKAAGAAEWGAQNTDKVRAGAGQVAAGAQWAAQPGHSQGGGRDGTSEPRDGTGCSGDGAIQPRRS